MILPDSPLPAPAPLLAVDPVWLGIGALILFALLTVVVVPAIFLYRPLTRRRIYRQAQRQLHDGRWEEAIATIHTLGEADRLPELWRGRMHNTEGECLRLAGDNALRDQRFEDGLAHYHSAAEFLGSDRAEARTRVIEAMLADIRRRFADWPNATIAETLDLVARTLMLESNSAEASFWKALCHVREEQWDAAIGALKSSHEAGAKRYLDPPLYLGILQIRLGSPAEAVRWLSEANRIDSNCPLVTWQMGLALSASGGDSGLAVRALQRAVGPRGLGPWIKNPERMWQETLPEGRSFVRRLAGRHRYECPLLGSDPAPMLRQARMGLAQAYYRQGSYEESAEVYSQLLQECPPTVVLLRGLGLALTRLERYDQAFKHLRTAFEQEEPKNHLTGGYLALCGALGKPSQEGDKAKNLAWAIRLLARFEAPGDVEWARIYSLVYAEARDVPIQVAVEDQVRLCDVLASVDAIDPRAAAAYDHLAATSANDLRSEHAWLYAKASVQEQWAGSQDLALLARTVSDSDVAREFFAKRQWDFDAIEFECLKRHAEKEPGRFPDTLGPEYHLRGELFLLSRSRQQEESGQKDAALTCMEVLLKLSPASTVAHDRLAQLHYHRGNLHRSAELLAKWQSLEPGNPWPLIRRAIVEQQREQPALRAEAIEGALRLTHGGIRAATAYLGAKLALREARKQNQAFLQDSEWARAEGLLHETLTAAPDHAEAACCLASLRAATGRFTELAELAPRFQRADVEEPVYHLLAAACRLAAGDAPAALDSAHRVTCNSALAAEGHFLIGMAHIQMNDSAAAAMSFREVTRSPSAPALDAARAHLGLIALAQHAYDEVIGWWKSIDPDKRRDWNLELPLQRVVYLAGIAALQNHDHQSAAGRLIEARQLGFDDQQLKDLLPKVLVQAAQELLFGAPSRPRASLELESGSNGQPHASEVEIYRYRPTASNVPNG